MTHDELLAKIYTIHNDNSDAGQEATKQYKGMVQFMQALRAVVELHKPYGQYCEACIENGNDYPCATIQVIEKELNG